MKAKAKVLIGSAVGLTLAGAAAGVAYFTLIDGKELRYKTQAALRSATPTLAAEELRARGHLLRGTLTCRDMPGWNKRSMRVRCDGATAGRHRVQVIGAAESKIREEYFTILVNGRPVVQNARCLAADCLGKD